MTLQLASLASFLLVVTGLTVFGLALRKASHLVRHAQAMIGAVSACSVDLDRALTALAAERETCERLEASLDTQLRHGRKTYKALSRTIDVCQRAKADMEERETQPAQGKPEGSEPPAAKATPRKLPAFVHRTVKSMHAAQALG